MTDWTSRRVETQDGISLAAYDCGGRGPVRLVLTYQTALDGELEDGMAEGRDAARLVGEG